MIQSSRSAASWRAQVLTRAKRYAEAKKKFEKLLQGMPPTSPEAMRVKIYLIQCNQAGTKGPGDAEKEAAAR